MIDSVLGIICDNNGMCDPDSENCLKEGDQITLYYKTIWIFFGHGHHGQSMKEYHDPLGNFFNNNLYKI
jgi:hypothetical protein